MKNDFNATVQQLAALVVLFRAGKPIGVEDFSERLWAKRNRFAVGFLRRMERKGLVRSVHVVLGSGFPSERWTLTDETAAEIRERVKE